MAKIFQKFENFMNLKKNFKKISFAQFEKLFAPKDHNLCAERWKKIIYMFFQP